jgi:hypothetical protein
VKTFHYQLNLQGLQASPVEDGHESYSVPLYARVKYDDVVHTAKIGIHLPAVHLAFGDREVLIDVVGIRSMMWEASDFNVLTVGLRSVCMN